MNSTIKALMCLVSFAFAVAEVQAKPNGPGGGGITANGLKSNVLPVNGRIISRGTEVKTDAGLQRMADQPLK
ncbi:hypothetical protein [uncultured Ruegeria sp.]|uniref:hypothetical protein n=1 Tax=uncultured Ruegeria sp. TaxID=259304 RepID=UPI0026390D91|nr:hypothetical protein [uncultured Ruegeria sp.]